jgi:hypothetical protein
MRKFLKVAALLAVVAVSACGEKTDDGMVDTTNAAATTDSTVGAMVDSMGTMVDSMGAIVYSMKDIVDTTQH